MDTLKQLLNDYDQFERENGDKRNEVYPFMSSPYPTIIICVLYLLMVWIGPRIMEKRKPLELKTYTKFYNLGQIIFCGYFLVNVYLLTEVEPDGYWLMCKRWDNTLNEKTKRIAFFLYLGYISRLTELTETAVHILRKKNRLISFLHVYHHTGNLLISYFSAKIQPGGTGATLVLLNFTVHFIMYNYYLMSMAKSGIWCKIAEAFKPHLTKLQLIQFVYMVILIGQDMVTTAVPKCYSEGFIIFPTYMAMGHILLNLMLFINFYIQNYMKGKKKTKST